MGRGTVYDANDQRFFARARRMAEAHGCQRFRFQGSLYVTSTGEKEIAGDTRYRGMITMGETSIYDAAPGQTLDEANIRAEYAGHKQFRHNWRLYSAATGLPAGGEPAPGCGGEAAGGGDPSKERRFRVVRLRQLDVLDWFTSAVKGWPRVITLPLVEGLPEGVRVVSVYHDFRSQTFEFLVAHPSFERVGECEPAPAFHEGVALQSRAVEILPEQDPRLAEYRLRELVEKPGLATVEDVNKLTAEVRRQRKAVPPW